jgi:hypothetical protein
MYLRSLGQGKFFPDIEVGDSVFLARNSHKLILVPFLAQGTGLLCIFRAPLYLLNTITNFHTAFCYTPMQQS